MINEHLSREHFDPQAIDSALVEVFGASNAGVNFVRNQVLSRFSFSLNVPKVGLSAQTKAITSKSDFIPAIQELVSNYRLLRASARVASSGAVAALISSICCLSPLVLALLGLASFSAAASLAMTLTSMFRPVELLAGLGLVSGVVYFQLRKENQCNLSGLRRNIGYVAVPLASMLLVYAIVNYLLYAYFLGMFDFSDLFP